MKSSEPNERDPTRRGTGPSDPSPPLSAHFVGREAELVRMLAGLEAAAAGRGNLVLLSGEPGIGKTRICEELDNLARARGVPVTWGRCWEGGGAQPYWPWIQVLRFCARYRAPAELTANAGDAARLLSNLMPDLFGEYRGERGQLRVMQAGDELSERFALFVAISDVLRNFAAKMPLVVVLDDLHSADVDSLMLTQFIARDLRRLSILMLVTYRDTQVRMNTEVGDLIETLTREGQNFALRGLSAAQIHEYVELSTGKTPSEQLVRELYRTTGGNPLFLAETAREMHSDSVTIGAGDTPKSAARIPQSIRAVIEARLRKLPQEARDFLLTAAVVGHEFDLRSVSEVSGIDSRQAAIALDEGSRHGLVARAYDTPDAYRFSHELVAEVIYDGIPADVRQTLHYRVAEYLARRQPSGRPGAHAALVNHYVRALPAAADRAVLYARKAAEDSTRLFAYGEAARFYEMALRALEQDRSASPRARCDLLLALGAVQCQASEQGGFRQTFLDAASIARSENSPEHLAKAALGYGMLGNALATGLAAPDQITKELLEEAIDAIEPADHPLRARLLARLAEEIGASAPRARLTTLIDEAVAIAQARGDAEAQADALFIKFRALVRGPDHTAESKAILQEILQIVERNKMDHWNSRISYHLGAVALETGDIAGVHDHVATIIAIPEALQRANSGRIDSEITLTIQAMWALIEGRVEDATRACREALVLGRRRRHSEAEAFFGLQIVSIFREQGRMAEVIGPTAANLANDPQNSLVRAILAFAQAQAGRTGDARVELARLEAHEFQSVRRDFTWLGAMAYSAETSAALGDRTSAAVLARLLEPMAERNVSIGFFCYLGPVAYYLGILAATLGSHDAASGHYEAAIDSAQQLGAIGWIARIQLRYARTLLERNSKGDLDRARYLIDQARATATTLGSNDLLAIAAEIAPRADTARAAVIAAAIDAPAANVFHKEGDYWTISFGGQTIRLHDKKGLVYISHLIANPGQELHVLKLEALAQGVAALGPNEIQLIEPASDAGEVLDSRAKREYHERTKELLQELEEARDLNDLGRIDLLNRELAALGEELTGAAGLGGRDRRAVSNVERARVRIKNTISAALVRIGAAHPALARHFASTLKTGVFCSYEPDSAQSAKWDF
ncbi:MAG: ATP-binding protein [Candidatus Binataceae bacterium]